MRRRGFTILQLLCVLALVVITAVILLPIFLGSDDREHSSCQSNLKQMSLAVFQYTQDYSKKFPIVKVRETGINEQNPLGWADALQPYLKSTQIYWCPEQIKNQVRDETIRKPSDRDYTDYFYNRRLSGVETKQVISPAITFMLGEGNDGTDAANARYSLSTLPAAWRKDKTSPSYRHLDGANYAYADGHVKWLQPEKVTDKKPDGSTSTFAIN